MFYQTQGIQDETKAVNQILENILKCRYDNIEDPRYFLRDSSVFFYFDYSDCCEKIRFLFQNTDTVMLIFLTFCF